MRSQNSDLYLCTFSKPPYAPYIHQIFIQFLCKIEMWVYKSTQEQWGEYYNHLTMLENELRDLRKEFSELIVKNTQRASSVLAPLKESNLHQIRADKMLYQTRRRRILHSLNMQKLVHMRMAAHEGKNQMLLIETHQLINKQRNGEKNMHLAGSKCINRQVMERQFTYENICKEQIGEELTQGLHLKNQLTLKEQVWTLEGMTSTLEGTGQ